MRDGLGFASGQGDRDGQLGPRESFEARPASADGHSGPDSATGNAAWIATSSPAARGSAGRIAKPAGDTAAGATATVATAASPGSRELYEAISGGFNAEATRIAAARSGAAEKAIKQAGRATSLAVRQARS